MPVRHSRDSKSPYYRQGNPEKTLNNESEDTKSREQATKANSQSRVARASGSEG